MYDPAKLLQAAVQYHQRGALQQAEELYKQVLEMDPGNSDATHLLGFLYAQAGNIPQGVQYITRAIAIRPDVAEYHNNLGEVYKAAGRFEEAIGSYQRAIELKPEMAGVYSNLGTAHYRLGRFQQAEEWYNKALSIQPDLIEALVNLASLQRDRRQTDAAIETYQKALQIRQSEPEAIYNLAWTLLQAGDFEQGWPLWESRFAVRRLGLRPRGYKQPVWDGSDLGGRTIFLYAENRLSDAIQFVRYAPLVAGKRGRVTIECHPTLVPVFQTVWDVERVIPFGAAPPAFDVYCSLQSLPRVFKTTLETIPDQVPYLYTEPRRATTWRIIVSDQAMKRVGLCWAGGRNNPHDLTRSMTLGQFAPLAGIPGVRFYSLQLGDAARQPPPPGLELIDYTTDLRDMSETAALVENLDLIISVDTSVAHLAGALGRPTWTLLSYAPDWRWLLDRTDSPWYPTMRLFRQKQWGDWAGVMAEVAGALTEWAQT